MTLQRQRHDNATGAGIGPPMAVLSGALCLSLSAILVKLADVDAATTAFLRCVIAVCVLIPIALWERERSGGLSRSGRRWAIAAGAALGVDYAAWTGAVYLSGAGISSVLINVQVIVLPALAFAIDRERAPRRFVLTVPVMLTGLVLAGGLVTGSAVAGASPLLGSVLGISAGVGYGCYLYLTRRGSRHDRGMLVQPLMWATLSATAVTAAVSPLSGGLHITGISQRSWAMLVTLAIIGQVVAWLLVNRGSSGLSSNSTAGLLLLQPIMALALGRLILDERPDVAQLVGAGLVIVAVAVANVARNGARHENPDIDVAPRQDLHKTPATAGCT